MMSTPTKLSFADSTRLLATLPAWQHDVQRDAITREFVFADFKTAFGFMTRIAELADQRDHHPEWSNVYNRVTITYTTHDADGLTQNDIDLARFADQTAASLGG